MLEVELNAINPDDEVKARYSKDVFLKCYETWIAKFIDLTVPVIQKFNKLFTDVNHQISLQQGGIYVSFNNEAAYIITENLKEEVQKNLGRISQIPPEIRIQASYGALIKGGLKTFRCTYGIIIKFEDLKYEVFVDDIDETNGSSVSKKQYTRLLHQPLTEKEMNDAAQMLGNAIFRHIDFYTRKNGLRQ